MIIRLGRVARALRELIGVCVSLMVIVALFAKCDDDHLPLSEGLPIVWS